MTLKDDLLVKYRPTLISPVANLRRLAQRYFWLASAVAILGFSAMPSSGQRASPAHHPRPSARYHPVKNRTATEHHCHGLPCSTVVQELHGKNSASSLHRLDSIERRNLSLLKTYSQAKPMRPYRGATFREEKQAPINFAYRGPVTPGIGHNSARTERSSNRIR